MSLLYWTSAGFLGAIWGGYPLALALQRARPVRKGEVEARVAVVCVVRNEVAHIARRIAELRSQSRAPDEVVIVDDGSTDGTAEAAEAAGARVLRQSARGKSAGVAAGVAATGGDIVVLCDVRQRLDPGAIAALLRPFADPAVGCVSGLLVMDAARGPGWYWRYEAWVRALESRSGSVVGATGALYAVRRELLVPPPEGLVLDDVWVPIHVARAGYRVVLEPAARATDIEADIAHERTRKVRTLSGVLQLYARAPWLALPMGNPIWLRALLHKAGRLLTPFALGGLAAGSVAGMLRPGPLWPVYAATAAGLGATVGAWAVRKARPGFGGRIGALAETVVEMQRATMAAWFYGVSRPS